MFWVFIHHCFKKTHFTSLNFSYSISKKEIMISHALSTSQGCCKTHIRKCEFKCFENYKGPHILWGIILMSFPIKIFLMTWKNTFAFLFLFQAGQRNTPKLTLPILGSFTHVCTHTLCKNNYCWGQQVQESTRSWRTFHLRAHISNTSLKLSVFQCILTLWR